MAPWRTIGCGPTTQRAGSLLNLNQMFPKLMQLSWFSMSACSSVVTSVLNRKACTDLHARRSSAYSVTAAGCQALEAYPSFIASWPVMSQKLLSRNA